MHQSEIHGGSRNKCTYDSLRSGTSRDATRHRKSVNGARVHFCAMNMHRWIYIEQ